MKIVLATHQFLPEYSYGTEIIALNVAKELQSRGHEVTIVTGHNVNVPLHDSERFDRYCYDGLKVERFLHACVPMGGQHDIAEAEYNNRLFHGWFKRFLTAHRPDIVHFVHLFRLSASAIDACLELGIRTVFTATDFWSICPTNQLLLPDGNMCKGPDPGAVNCLRHIVELSQGPAVRRAVAMLPGAFLSYLIRICRRVGPGAPLTIQNVRSLELRQQFIGRRTNRIDRIVVPSRIMGELLTANGLDRSRIVHLPYGIVTSRIPRALDKGRHRELRIGFIGRIQESKGLHVLIDAVLSLDPALPVKLTIHGRTDEYLSYAGKLRRLADGDPRIAFAGSFTNDKIGEILQAIDVLVCPSTWYENTPLVIYEAMAAGCPVIASNLPGMAESIDPNVNGLLFEPGNNVQLAAILGQLAANRGSLAELSAGTRLPLSVADHVAALEHIYEQALSSARS